MSPGLLNGYAAPAGPIKATLSVRCDKSDEKKLFVSSDVFQRLLLSDEANWIYVSIQMDNDERKYTCEALIDPDLNFNSALGLNIHNDALLGRKKCFISKVNPISLNSVIVGVPPQVYQLVRNRDTNSTMHLVAGGSNENVIRQGDNVKWLNGTILLCEPLSQGLINFHTNLTFVRFEKKAKKVAPLPEFDMQKWGAFSVCDVRIQSVNTKKWHNGDEDDNYSIFVTLSVQNETGCINGDLAWLKVRDKEFLVKIFSLPMEDDSKTAYICPTLFLNLKTPPSGSLRKAEMKETLCDSLPLAKEVMISRVASPVTLDRTFQHTFLVKLRTHFERVPRIVMNGQLIAIPLDSNIARGVFDALEETNDPDAITMVPEGISDSVAWFQVSGIQDLTSSSCQFIIDPLRTKMVQSGVIRCAPPAADEQMLEYLEISRPFHSKSELSRILKTVQQAFSNGKGLASTVLVHSLTRGIGKKTLVETVAQSEGFHFLNLECYQLFNPSQPLKCLGTIRGKCDRLVQECHPLVICFQHVDALAKTSERQQNQQNGFLLKLAQLIQEYVHKKGVAVVGTSNDLEHLSDTFRSIFKFEYEVKLPGEDERKLMYRHLLDNNSFPVRQDVDVGSLSVQSAGLAYRDLASILKRAKMNALERMEKLSLKLGCDFETVKTANGGVVDLHPADFSEAINEARNKLSDSIGAPKIPDVKWQDVGGLESVKGDILDTIDMPLKHPELFAAGIKKRSGILFYGPPGTGKTLLAKAIATNFSLNFFSVKGPELLNMYIGESEANVRRVFQKARDAKPCVVFFDELDSVAPKRGNQGDSGGVMDRIVSQLLAELDGMNGGDADGVFVVGATNRPDLLDEALLRPGRFDKMLYLGISDTHEKQAKILEALTRKFSLDPSVDMYDIACKCGFNFTGADFYALCSDAMLNAMTRTAGVVEEKFERFNKKRSEKMSLRWWFDRQATEDDIRVVVEQQDFIKARDLLKPSVSQDELDHYLRVRENFEGTGQ